MKVLAHQTVAKSLQDPESNDDVFLADCGDSCRRVIVADGATCGFAGGIFAKSIALAYLSCASEDWKSRIADARKKYDERIDRAALSWSQIISCARGSFSTLLALEEKEKGILATAVGDTCCFAVDKTTYLPLRSFPIESPSDFGSRPLLVGSRWQDDVMFEPVYRKRYWSGRLITYDELANAWILCATDAIARFILVNKEDSKQMQELIDSLNDSESFRRFVEDARRTKGLQSDDTTVALIDACKETVREA